MNNQVNFQLLKKKVITRILLVYLILILLIFLSAGTLNYWEGWTYMAVIACPMTIFIVSMFKQDPDFLERRMRVKEKRKKQKLVVRIGTLPFLFAFIVPGFDRRYGWSDISVFVTVAGLTLVLLSYLAILHVFRTNSYASRVIEVENDQKVITIGPYRLVRHPMYSSMIIFYLFTPLALRSYWAIIPTLFIIPVLIFRIIDEEKELIDNLQGYRQYLQKVKYRLIPGIW